MEMRIYVFANGFDRGRDLVISKLARKYKGQEEGAGTNLWTGGRDMSFCFNRRDNAKRFARAVRRLDLPRGFKVTKVGTYVEPMTGRARWVAVK